MILTGLLIGQLLVHILDHTSFLPDQMSIVPTRGAIPEQIFKVRSTHVWNLSTCTMYLCVNWTYTPNSGCSHFQYDHAPGGVTPKTFSVTIWPGVLCLVS
jgi:hypothetical protein